MSETFHDREPKEPTLNRVYIIDKLQEFGIDVELSDWIDYDDNEILRELASYSAMLNIDIEDMFEACGIEIESTGESDEV